MENLIKHWKSIPVKNNRKKCGKLGCLNEGSLVVNVPDSIYFGVILCEEHGSNILVDRVAKEL